MKLDADKRLEEALALYEVALNRGGASANLLLQAAKNFLRIGVTDASACVKTDQDKGLVVQYCLTMTRVCLALGEIADAKEALFRAVGVGVVSALNEIEPLLRTIVTAIDTHKSVVRYALAEAQTYDGHDAGKENVTST